MACCSIDGERPTRNRAAFSSSDASPIPIIVYNIPKYTHVTLEAGLVRELARHENVGGIKVHPLEVEHLLSSHPLVREAAVCAVSNRDDSVQLRAYVVRADGPLEDDDLADELTTLARRHLTAYKVPRKVVFVPSLPRTGSGKLRRHVVRTWKP